MIIKRRLETRSVPCWWDAVLFGFCDDECKFHRRNDWCIWLPAKEATDSRHSSSVLSLSFVLVSVFFISATSFLGLPSLLHARSMVSNECELVRLIPLLGSLACLSLLHRREGSFHRLSLRGIYNWMATLVCPRLAPSSYHPSLSLSIPLSLPFTTLIAGRLYSHTLIHRYNHQPTALRSFS